MVNRLKKIFGSNSRWLEKKQTSLLSAAFVIVVANMGSSLFGLIRQRFLLSTFFGDRVSQLALESLKVAFQIPDTLYLLIVMGTVSSAFIPMFTAIRAKSEKEAFEITSSFMNLILLFFAFVAIIVFIFTKPLILMLTGHMFTSAQVQMAINLTRLMLLAQVFFTISNFLTGILQSYQHFIISSLSPILYNIGIILGVIFFHENLGIYSAGLGAIIGAFFHMAVQLPLAWKLGFKFSLKINIRHPELKKFFTMIPPKVLTLGVNSLYQKFGLVFFATSIGNLSLVMIDLALKLITIPIRLSGVPIAQASLPFLSEKVGNIDKFRQLVIQSLNQISFLALPTSILVLILRLPFVRLVFGTRNFPWESTVMTGKLVAIIAISIVAQAMTHLLTRAFYALKDTKTPFFITLVTVFLYFTISTVVVFYLKRSVLGLAFVLSLTSIVEAFMLIIFLDLKIHELLLNRSLLVAQGKMFLTSFMMAVFLYLPYKILDNHVFDTTRTIELIGLTVTTAIIGILVYIYFAVLLDVKELKYVSKIFDKFGHWQKSLSKSSEVLLEGGTNRDEI